jgi:hypothetical protein
MIYFFVLIFQNYFYNHEIKTFEKIKNLNLNLLFFYFIYIFQHYFMENKN